jgi:hypothetical protein
MLLRPGRTDVSGLCNGFASISSMGLAYENRPGRSATVDGRADMLHRFSQPIELKAGGRVRLLAQHNGYTLLISDLPG